MTFRRFFSVMALGGAALAMTGHAQAQQLLMVPESSNDRVMLFDAFDGSLVDANFIDLVPQGASTPISAVNIGQEIWVADQVADSIFRYDTSGNFISTITGEMDNIRGMGFAANTVYQTNAGSNNNAPGEAVIQFAEDGTRRGSFAVVDPFDALPFNGDLLVNDIDNDDLVLYTLDGTFIRVWHDSDGVTGIDFPEQMTLRRNGNVLAGGFSSPAGVYEYDSVGNQLNYWDVGTGVRGAHELGNGNIMFTDGSGVHILDPNTSLVTDVITDVSARFIEPLQNFRIDQFGGCPGSVQVEVNGATPNGTVAMVFSPARGSTTIQSGTCAGTTLDLDSGGIRLLQTTTADAGGNASFNGNAPAAACGGFLQAIDASTCLTSNVMTLRN
ncbi:MAG: hypothetical protein ACF8PN_06095 [Phycisphaerales bacterium]